MPSILVPAFLLAALLVSCGDDSSSVSSYEQTSEMSSSSVNDDSSSSIGSSGSSAKNDKSSSSVKVKDSSSSRKIESSSSSAKTKESSSSKIPDESSSSVEINSSSSSIKTESSSSSAKTKESSSSKIPDESSSSVEINSSSSSIKTESSSSSEIVVESSSDVIVEESSSSVQSSSSMNSIYDAVNNTLTDLRDNRVYKTVTIGEQIWMAENLNYMPEDTAGTIYSGGTVCGGDETEYEGDSKRCDEFGRLYLRKVALYKAKASDRRGICPDGWVIPKKGDWENLVEFLGENAAVKMRKNNANWLNEATNTSGFSALKTCLFSASLNRYKACAAFYYYWSSNTTMAYFFCFFDYDELSNSINYANGTSELMYSVRCIKE